MKTSLPVFQIVGYSNRGKTTLLTQLISRLAARNIRVGVIKHDGAHDFQIDQPGKDTWQYREAGASLTAIQSASRTAFMEERQVPLAQLVERMAAAGAQFILVEGFKREHYPKLVLIKEEQDPELIDSLSEVAAIASWSPFAHASIPAFSIDDYDGITEFLLTYFEQQGC